MGAGQGDEGEGRLVCHSQFDKNISNVDYYKNG
jgi:hypothetical protein